MRLLLVSDFYPPLVGGAERQTALLARHLAQRGHQVNVATVWQQGTPFLTQEDGVTVHRLQALATRVPWFSTVPKRRYHPPFPDASIVWGLRRVIAESRPDLVHAYGWISYSCALALAGRRIPLLLSVREYGNSCAVRTLMRYGQLCRGPAWGKCLRCSMHHYGALKGAAAALGVLACRPLLTQRVNGVHSISRFVQAVVHRDLLGERRGRGSLPEQIIPSFREVHEHARPDESLLARLPREPFILYVGALQEIKGLGTLLAAYRQLVSPPPLVLMGTRWPDTPAAFPPGVIAFHDVPHATVMAAWERCLFGVAPSIWPEPLGVVVHEGMSQGKAMIGTIPGGHADMIIDGESGLLVPAGDTAALAAAMQRLLTNPAWRERLGEAARERARLFTNERVIPQFEDLYGRTVESFRRQGRGVVPCVE